MAHDPSRRDGAALTAGGRDAIPNGGQEFGDDEQGRAHMIGGRMIAALLAAGLALNPTSHGVAQEKFPSRPIEVIVPAPPGGGTDITMRMLAASVEPILGQKVVIVNRGGGGGVPAFVSLMEAKPDGYVLGAWYNGQLIVQPHTTATPYTPTDFTPISLYSASPVALCTDVKFKANDGKQLLDEIRATPGKYTFGNDGPGGLINLAAQRVFQKFDAKVISVPFGGAGETLKAVLGGHIDIYGGPISAIMPHVKAGTSKCLLVSSAARSPMMANVMSVDDLGVTGLDTTLWRGVFGPKGMAPDRVAILEQAFRRAATSGEYRAAMEARGEVAVGSTAEELKTRVAVEDAQLGAIVKSLGLGK